MAYGGPGPAQGLVERADWKKHFSFIYILYISKTVSFCVWFVVSNPRSAIGHAGSVHAECVSSTNDQSGPRSFVGASASGAR